MLVISLALCLGMVLLADYVNLSTALGAFVIGSILGSTTEAHRIENMMTPIKNLFGAIFFVSVGMMAEPSVILAHWDMILLVLVLVVIVKPIMGTLGVYLSCRGLENSVRAGFSFGHIGEFSFIIASLGISTGVLDDYIYPVVIAVSVITTITTPYVIRLSTPVYKMLDKRLPIQIRRVFESSKTTTKKKFGRRSVLLKQFITETFIISILLIGIYALMGGIISPLLTNLVTQKLTENAAFVCEAVSVSLTLLLMMPFLSALILRKKYLSRGVFLALIKGKNEKLFLALQLFRAALVVGFIAFVMITSSPFVLPIDLAISAVVFLIVLFSRGFLSNYTRLERLFLFNYNEADNAEHQEQSYSGVESNGGIHVTMNDINEGDWLSESLKAASLRIDEDSPLLNKTLIELNLRAQYGLFIIRIEREGEILNIPAGNAQIQLGDLIYIVGEKDSFKPLYAAPWKITEKKFHFHSMQEFATLTAENGGNLLKCIGLPIGPEAYFLGKSLKESAIAVRNRCLVIGIETESRVSMNPSPDEVLAPGARLWVVGEMEALEDLIRANLA